MQRQAVDLDAFGDTRINEILDGFLDCGRHAVVLDLTNDLRIPVFAAIAAKADGTSPCFGAAASLSPREAALRALSEAAQVAYWSETAGGSPELRWWLENATTAGQQYLTPRGVVSPGAAPRLEVPAALEFCLSRLREANLDAYWVDMTRGEIGVPVVRVIVPELRHVWRRLAAGRLYSVPVQMDWLREPLRECEMNPISCML